MSFICNGNLSPSEWLVSSFTEHNESTKLGDGCSVVHCHKHLLITR